MSPWLLGSVALGFLAATLGAWSLFSDRARGRKRCPRCWYDMAGAMGRTCPECGKEAASERHLQRTRRRWRWTALALAVGLVAYGLRATGIALEHGWPRAIPGTVLIFIAPVEPPSFTVAAGYVAVLAAAKPTTLQDELEWRLLNDRLAAWQVRIVVGRGTTFRPARGRDKWPIGRRIPIEMDLPSGLVFRGDALFRSRAYPEDERGRAPTFPQDGAFPLATSLGPHIVEGELVDGVRFDTGRTSGQSPLADLSRARRLWKGKLGAIEIVPHARDVLLPLRSAEADAIVAAALRAALIAGSDGRARLWLRVGSIDPASLPGVGVEPSWQVLRDGEVVGRAWVKWMRPDTTLRATPPSAHLVDVEWIRDSPAAGPLGPGWVIRASGDAHGSIEDPRLTHYWAGTIDFPVDRVRPLDEFLGSIVIPE